MQGQGSALGDHIQGVAEEFNKALYKGKEWEWKVYRLLKQRFPDIRPPLTYEQAIGRVDLEPDMAIRGLPIQCKRREFAFTGAADWPYPTVFIDEEYKLRSDYLSVHEYNSLPDEEKRANLRLFMAYFIASENMEYMGVVIPASKAYWSRSSVSLRRDFRQASAWECPVSKVIWTPVSEWRTILTRV